MLKNASTSLRSFWSKTRTHLNAQSSAALASSEFTRELPNTPSPEFPGELTASKIVSDIPGPRSEALRKQMNQIQQTGAVHFFVDYAKSMGNYIADVDGNHYLDVLGQIASLPIGYNHPAIIEAMQDPKNMPMLAQRPCLGMLPPEDWTNRVNSTLMSVAPSGLSEVATMMCGSCSNENAFKAVFIWYQTMLRGGPPSEEDLQTCMQNQAPGSPELSILSFSGGFHGRLMGCMSATHSKAIHKVDIPAFDWPVASFPKLKYPLEEFCVENTLEEARCLAEVEELLIKHKDHKPIAGMIIEPIQAEGGDNYASKEFFQGLRKLAEDYEVAFMVDEVQTGGGSTGTFWAHEQWELDNPPDIVTFSKKMQTGGYYSKPEFRPQEAYRIFNTWMGDPSKIIQLEAFLNTMKKDSLLENTEITGNFLLGGLKELESRYPDKIFNTRGVGTYIAIDMKDSAARDNMIMKLRRNGIEAGGCGDVSIRFRPALIFQPRHAAEALDIFEHSIN